MLTHELDSQVCREFLRNHDVARLACAHHDQPYIVPISYSFDGGRDCLYAFSGTGQKVAWMRENPRVCIEVDEISDTGHWTSVLVYGRYEELTVSPDDHDARARALDLFQTRKEWWLPAAARPAAGDDVAAVVLFRIQIERVTGRKVERPPFSA